MGLPARLALWTASVGLHELIFGIMDRHVGEQRMFRILSLSVLVVWRRPAYCCCGSRTLISSHHTHRTGAHYHSSHRRSSHSAPHTIITPLLISHHASHAIHLTRLISIPHDSSQTHSHFLSRMRRDVLNIKRLYWMHLRDGVWKCSRQLCATSQHHFWKIWTTL